LTKQKKCVNWLKKLDPKDENFGIIINKLKNIGLRR
jgi:hypothetical protein